MIATIHTSHVCDSETRRMSRRRRNNPNNKKVRNQGREISREIFVLPNREEEEQVEQKISASIDFHFFLFSLRFNIIKK